MRNFRRFVGILAFASLTLAATAQNLTFLWMRSVPGSPQAVAVSNDGQIIYVGSTDNSIQAYLANDGAFMFQRTSLPGPVGGLALSPNNQLLASCSFIFEGSPGGDSNTRIWNATDLSPVATLPGSGADIMDVHFSKDGSRLITIDSHGAVRLYKTSDWSLEKSAVISSSGVRARFVGAGDTAVCVDFSGQLRVVSIPDLSVVRQTWSGVSSFLGAIAISPDGHNAVVEAFNVLSWINLDTLQRFSVSSQVMQGYDADWSRDGANVLLTGLPFTSTQRMMEDWDSRSRQIVAGFSSGNSSMMQALGVRHRPKTIDQFVVGIGAFPPLGSQLALVRRPRSLFNQNPVSGGGF